VPRISFHLSVALPFLLLCAACDRQHEPTTVDVNDEALSRALATLMPTQGNVVTGTVAFRSTTEGGVRVQATVDGLAPGSTHGFHIHEKGDCGAPDGTSAGGHYNPTGAPHGLPPNEPRHAGDLGNITADAAGRATLDQVFTNFSLDWVNPVRGLGVIVHEKADQGTQPTGNAGARLACGVIGSP
jgi:superoxide dismutase, Cu-Zn family